MLKKNSSCWDVVAGYFIDVVAALLVRPVDGCNKFMLFATTNSKQQQTAETSTRVRMYVHAHIVKCQYK